MNIVFATYPFAFVTPGGGEIQLLKYLQHLAATGVRVARHDIWQGFGQFDANSILHFSSCMPGSAPFLRFCSDQGFPVVVSPNLWITPETKHLYPFNDIQAALDIADAVVCNSDAECEQMSASFGLRRGKLFTVYNGVDDHFFSPVCGEKFRETIGELGKFVLNVGNIEPRKNQLALVRAMKSFPSLQLVVIGKVRDEAYARQCAEEGGGQWLYAGSLPHESELLRSAYAACEVFVLPSTLETPGLAALEAAACGCPVVVTAVGSTKEYFGTGAIYVDPDSIDSIVGGLRRALVGGRAPVGASDFSWQKVIPRLLSVYEDVLHARARKATFFSEQGLEARGFGVPELSGDGCFAWAGRNSALVMQGGLLTWRWWAPSDLEVDIFLDGDVLREGVRVGPVWDRFYVALTEGRHELAFRVRGEVLEQGGRELGVMFREPECLAHEEIRAGEREAWCLARGLVFEAVGCVSEGFNAPERDEEGPFVWSTSAFSLRVRPGRMYIEGFVPQACRVCFSSGEAVLFSTDAELGVVRWMFDVPASEAGASVVVCGTVERASLAEYGDNRDLGVAFRSLRIV